jgi:hypothetical protein
MQTCVLTSVDWLCTQIHANVRNLDLQQAARDMRDPNLVLIVTCTHERIYIQIDRNARMVTS